MSFNRSSDFKIRSHIENLLVQGSLFELRKSASSFLLLDYSLITRKKNLVYDLKIINCNGKLEIWKFPNKRFITDKNLEKDKEPFIVNCNKRDLISLKGKESDICVFPSDHLDSSPLFRVSNTKKHEQEQRFKELQKRTERKINTEKKILKKNIDRSKFDLFRLVKCNYNDFDTFLTLTFKENVTDLDFSLKCFQNFVRSLKNYFKRKNQEFKYLVVPEFQKRGAVHFHLLTNISYDWDDILEEKEIFNEKKGWIKFKYLKKYWNYGFSSLEKIKDENVGGYLTKFSEYLTKYKDNRLFGRRRYSYSYNLKKPEVIYLNSDDVNAQNLMFNFYFQSNEVFKDSYYDVLGNEIYYRCWNLVDDFDKRFVVGE